MSVPDRLRLAAYEAHDHGVPAIHLRAILDAEEELERLIGWPGHLSGESTHLPFKL